MGKKNGKKRLNLYGKNMIMEGMLLRVLEEAVRLNDLLKQQQNNFDVLLSQKQDTCDLLLRQNKQQADLIKNLTNERNNGRIVKEQGESSVTSA